MRVRARGGGPKKVFSLLPTQNQNLVGVTVRGCRRPRTPSRGSRRRGPTLARKMSAFDAEAAQVEPFLHNGCPIVDLRSPNRGGAYLIGAASVPASLLTESLQELPPRGVGFYVLHDSSAPCLAALAKLRKLTVGADVRGLLEADTFFATRANAPVVVGSWPPPLRARLWRPGPLAAALAARAREWAALPKGAPLAVLDLGCGAGRNAVHLAERLGPLSAVVAVDNRRVLCSRMARFAAREVGSRGGAVRCVGWEEEEEGKKEEEENGKE